MAKKPKLAKDEKFDRHDLNLFQMLEAIDRKDYGFFDRLTVEQQKKFVPFLTVQWASAVTSDKDIQNYYLQSFDQIANRHLFNENIIKNPKLQWLMLCAASPGLGKLFHQWIPQIKERFSRYRENATTSDIAEYFEKIYPKDNPDDIIQLAEAYVEIQKKRVYLSKAYPDLKLDEIELLSELITDEEIQDHKENSGEV